MGEHQQPRPSLGRDAPGVPGGQVPVLARQRSLGVSEGGLTHHHVRAVPGRKDGARSGCSDAQTVSASSVAAANPTWLAVRHSWPFRRSIRPTAASTS